MNRKTGQTIALLAILTLIIALVWYQIDQSGLRTSVLNQYGYPTTTSGQTTPQSLPENPPRSTSVVNGVKELRYVVGYDERVILDALQNPQQIPSFYTVVQWVSDRGNPRPVILDDDRGTRTFFKAPTQSGTYKFMLRVQQSGSLVDVARYVVEVVDPIVIRADANQDDKYDFADLVQLLQNWDSYGADATRVLSVILSRYDQ